MRLICSFFVGVVVLAARAEEPIQNVQQAREATSVSFEVHAPGVVVSGPPTSARVSLPGFDAVQGRSGVPDLPEKTVLIAIPPAATPTLEVRSAGERVLSGVRPRLSSVSETESALAGEDAKQPQAYPRSVAWLGEEGVLRDQRYVTLHLAPVRYDPELPGLRVEESYEVTVHFEGDPGLRSDPPTERVFEEVYRKAFLNYGQGRGFRLSALEPRVESSAATTRSVLSGPIYRITIRQNAVVRLDHALMSSTPFLPENLSTWKLMNRGVEVPLDVHDDGDGVLEPGEWVQFYGQKLDDEPKAILNHDFPQPEFADLWEARDFSDDDVYFLTVDGSSARARMLPQDGTPTQTRIPPADFEAVAHAEIDNSFRPLSDADPWCWSPSICITSCGGSFPTQHSEPVALPGLASGTLAVRAVVRLHGISSNTSVFPDHKTSVSLVNAAAQNLITDNDNGTFDGRSLYTHDFSVTPTVLAPATDPLTVVSAVVSSGVKNEVILDWIDVHYRRTFTASGGVLTFDWPDEDAEFVVAGLPSATPAIYEITGRIGATGVVNALRLTGASVSGSGPYSVRFRADVQGLPPGTLRRFVVVADTGVSAPAPSDMAPDTVSTLRSTSNQADMIVIVNPSVVNLAQGAPLDQLLDRRATQGITSIVAKIEDVQDEFNDGLSGPQAIAKFLKWVMSTNPGEGWANPKPSYVLLIGDGSYDYKGGAAAGNFVPTQIVFKDSSQIGYYASDSMLATAVGDDPVPDLVVGRISARNTTESDLVLQKTLNYETNPAPGNWRHHALLISDRGTNTNPGGDGPTFEEINRIAEGLMAPPYSSRNLRYWSDYCGATSCVYPDDADAIRADIKASVNGSDGFSDGAVLVQYMGHGNFDWWSNDAFFDDFDDPQHPEVPRDTSHLTNGLNMPWLLVHTCLTGGFHTTADHTMGEDWMKRVGGGAVAVLAPTGLGFDYIGREMTQVIWDDLLGNTKERSVAVPVMDALVFLCTGNYFEPCQYYVLQGDPSLTLAMTSVAPPTAVAAVAGNHRVDLTWTASATPGVTYSVLRSELQPLAYTAVATGLATTQFADTSAVNTHTYLYYVIAKKDLFESRWSNFNSDCGVNGPDCVRATPTNPNPPPVPPTPTVTNTERGGQLRVDWVPNTPTDEIQTYTIHYRIDPGPYTVHINTGAASSFGLVGLENGRRYYVALTATNTSGHTSGYSTEVSAIPTALAGIKPPAFISTLHVDRASGTDNAVLTWAAVTTDIYEGAENVSLYEVYRGTTPDFLPSIGNRIGTSPTPSYTDLHALSASSNYYYLVRAVDVDGNGGGLGNDLPNGVFPLQLNWAALPPGDVVLSWPAVTTMIGGAATHIARYDVYASSVPFTRAQMAGMTPIRSVTGTTTQITPSGARQYYSVLAVDTKGNVSPF